MTKTTLIEIDGRWINPAQITCIESGFNGARICFVGGVDNYLAFEGKQPWELVEILRKAGAITARTPEDLSYIPEDLS